MSLTDTQIYKLAERMRIPIASVCFKDELPSKLQFNKSYIINLQDSIDEDGQENDGTHWTMLQCNQYPNGTKECFFFDPYGAPPSEVIKKAVASTNGKPGLPYNTKDIQSLMNNACGFYCLALAHFINASQFRSQHLYTDVDNFLEMFDDLNKSVDFKKNEYILKHFFRSEDPSQRREIDVIKSTESITSEDDKSNRPDMFRLPVDINIMK